MPMVSILFLSCKPPFSASPGPHWLVATALDIAGRRKVGSEKEKVWKEAPYGNFVVTGLGLRQQRPVSVPSVT